jgi:hypothetical protein
MSLKTTCTRAYDVALASNDANFNVDSSDIEDRITRFFRKKFRFRGKIETIDVFSGGICFVAHDSSGEDYEIQCIEYPRQSVANLWGKVKWKFSYAFWLVLGTNTFRFDSPEELGRIFKEEGVL